MAYTQAARFSLTVLDELGTEGSDTYYAMLDPTQTIASLVAAWTSLAGVVDPVTGGQILRGSISILMPEFNPGKTISGSRVEQTGVFNFLNGTTTRRYGQPIIALNNSVVVAGKINLADAGVAALITFLTTALTVARWVNEAQQPLTTLRDALISFRKRRKQLSRSSYEL